MSNIKRNLRKGLEWMPVVAHTIMGSLLMIVSIGCMLGVALYVLDGLAGEIAWRNHWKITTKMGFVGMVSYASGDWLLFRVISNLE